MPDYSLFFANWINRAFMIFCTAFALYVAASLNIKASAQSADDSPWTLTCAADNKNFCLMRSSIFTESNQTIARVVIGESAVEGRKVQYLNAFLPLKLSIPAGVGFRVDEGEIVRLNLQYCDQQFCRAMTLLNENHIASMQRGGNLQLILTDSDSEKALGLNMSLMGFTKTHSEFQIATNATQ